MMSEEENVNSPTTDWLDTPLGDEEEFKTRIDDEWSPDEYSGQNIFRDANSFETDDSTPSMVQNHVKREREQRILSSTVDMDFGFQKEVCEIRGVEIVSLESFEFENTLKVAVGGLGTFLIIDYETGEILENLKELVDNTGCFSLEFWKVDQLLLINPQVLLCVINEYLFAYSLKTRLFTHAEEQQRIEGRPYLKVSTGQENSQSICRLGNTQALFLGSRGSRMTLGSVSLFLFSLAEEKVKIRKVNLGNGIQIRSEGLRSDSCVIRHPSFDENRTIIIADGNVICYYRFPHVEETSSLVCQSLQTIRTDERETRISAIGFLPNSQNGVLIIGFRRGMIQIMEVFTEKIIHQINLSSDILSLLTLSNSFFFACSSTERVYGRIPETIVRKNTCNFSCIKWLVSSEKENQVFLSGDINGGVKAWRNIFFFEKMDEVERVKDVLEEIFDDEDEKSVLYKISLWGGKEIFGLRIFFQ